MILSLIYNYFLIASFVHSKYLIFVRKLSLFVITGMSEAFIL